jgi:hypothetical protein
MCPGQKGHLGEALATVRADSANLRSYQTATTALDFPKSELTRSLILRLATNAQVANAQRWSRLMRPSTRR